MLLRHGHAHPESPHAEDFDRELTPRGRHEAQAVGARLAADGPVPDVLFASPAARTTATAQIVASCCAIDPGRIEYDEALYLAGPEAIWRVLTERGANRRRVLVCAHNPGISDLAGRLGPHPQRLELPTAGLVIADWPLGEWHGVRPESAGRREVFAPGRQ